MARSVRCLVNISFVCRSAGHLCTLHVIPLLCCRNMKHMTLAASCGQGRRTYEQSAFFSTKRGASDVLTAQNGETQRLHLSQVFRSLLCSVSVSVCTQKQHNFARDSTYLHTVLRLYFPPTSAFNMFTTLNNNHQTQWGRQQRLRQNEITLNKKRIYREHTQQGEIRSCGLTKTQLLCCLLTQTAKFSPRSAVAAPITTSRLMLGATS